MMSVVLPYLLGLLGVAAGAAGIWFGGRRSTKPERDKLNAYKDTRERMDAVDTSDDADAARSWLRDRGKR
jgi:hypothetical protein